MWEGETGRNERESLAAQMTERDERNGWKQNVQGLESENTADDWAQWARWITG
jgi:hypothetical protein